MQVRGKTNDGDKMKTFCKQNTLTALSGFAIGLINGLLGAGGGMIAIPILKKQGFSQKEAHTNAIAIILPITLLSSILYLVKGYVTVKDAFIYMPTGLIGAVIGTYILHKISPTLLKKIFGFLMLYAGIRLFIK